MRTKLATALSEFFLGTRSLSDLQEWLLSNLQDVLDSDDAVAIEVANNLDADLMELGEALIDDTIFMERAESAINKLQSPLC